MIMDILFQDYQENDLGSGETVTTGGSGFGVMALLVGVERGLYNP